MVRIAALIPIALLPLVAFVDFAQSSNRYVGTVQALRPDHGGEIEIKPDNGTAQVLRVVSESVFQRVAPGDIDLAKAQSVRFSDLADGDRVLVVVEPGTADIRRLIVMSASAITKKREAERLDWQTRGISGVVTGKQGDTIHLRSQSLLSSDRELIVTVSASTRLRRYAPDSVKFSDARPSSIAELNIGDQVRARGSQSPAGPTVAAEEVVFGTFVTRAGKIVSVSVDGREVTITDWMDGTPLVVQLTTDSQLKQMPALPPMAGTAGGPGMLPPGGGMPAPPAGMAPPDLSQMLERLPLCDPRNLKVGDIVVVSATKGSTPRRVTAITMLVNAGMLIRMATMQRGGANGNRAPGSPAMQGGGPGSGMMSGGMTGGLEGLQLSGMIP